MKIVIGLLLLVASFSPFGVALSASNIVEFAAAGLSYSRLFVDDVQVSQYTTQHKAIKTLAEKTLANPSEAVRYDHDYGVRVETFLALATPPDPEDPPARLSTTQSLLYETTFDYSRECSGTGAGKNLSTECDSISDDSMLNWNDIDSKQPGFGSSFVTSAVAAANNPNGGGGLGARFFVNDGSNQGSVSNRIVFPQEKEIWVRWYQRYEPGFAWANGNPSYDKCIYVYSSGPGGGKGFALLAEHQAGSFAVWTDTRQPLIKSSPAVTWQDVFGLTSDGLFHLFELHIKVNSSLGVADGVVQYWIDGIKYIDERTVDFTTGSDNPAEALAGVGRLDFHSNQRAPANGRPSFVDYDDIAISTMPTNVSPDGDKWIGRHDNDPG